MTIAVVLLDVMMPEMDGYETLAAIKSDDALRHVPVIMISGVDELDSVARCIELGATDYLPKPFNPVILGARVRASLADKRMRDLELAHAAQQQALLETIERQKDELSRFLSPQVAALVSSPEGEQLLAGHRRLATAVFCDLRGFTNFSDSAEPEEVLSLLREYHAPMGELIVEYGGTLEHFAGDGMMVFFNDPVLQEDHVARAVRMSVAMRADVRRPGYALVEAGLRAGSGHRHCDRLRHARPDRLRGPLRLRHGRHGRHRRVTPQLRGRGKPDPAQPTGSRRGGMSSSVSRRSVSCRSRASRARSRPSTSLL